MLGNIKYLKECFTPDFDRGLLFWNRRPAEHFCSDRQFKRWNTIYAGKVAGSVQNISGYKRFGLAITVDGEKFNLLVHRVIWTLKHGRNPNGVIDHIDGNPLNNKISNLRDVNKGENSKNKRLQKNNKSGIHGIYYRPEKGNMYYASIRCNKKQIHIGAYEDFFSACCARKSAENKLNFHENHGKNQPIEQLRK